MSKQDPPLDSTEDDEEDEWFDQYEARSHGDFEFEPDREDLPYSDFDE